MGCQYLSHLYVSQMSQLRTGGKCLKILKSQMSVWITVDLYLTYTPTLTGRGMLHHLFCLIRSLLFNCSVYSFPHTNCPFLRLNQKRLLQASLTASGKNYRLVERKNQVVEIKTRIKLTVPNGHRVEGTVVAADASRGSSMTIITQVEGCSNCCLFFFSYFYLCLHLSLV